MPRPLEAPPVAAIAGDALPMMCGRLFGCPKPCGLSVPGLSVPCSVRKQAGRNE